MERYRGEIVNAALGFDVGQACLPKGRTSILKNLRTASSRVFGTPGRKVGRRNKKTQEK